MKVPLLDLAPYHARIRGRVLDALLRVYDSGVFVLGSEVERFELELAERIQCGYAIGVSSGTDALLTALLALSVDRDSEVITTPFTFFATASAIVASGARVRFADIDPDGFGIHPEAVEAALGPATRAVIGVHLFGEACAVLSLKAICDGKGVALIEDAAQALGGRIEGRSLGTIGDVGCYSFFPSKSLGALGDGGAVVTHDETLAAAMRRVRVHGAAKKHEHAQHGGNFRLDEIQAAVLRLKLRDVTHRLQASRRHASYYDEAFLDLSEVIVPVRPPSSEASHSLYTLRVLTQRDELRAALAEEGIATQIHYPKPLHLQPALSHLGYARGDFPNAERRSEEVLSIPLFPDMTNEQREHVAACVRAFFR